MKLPSARWFKSVLEEFKASNCRFICHASNKFDRKWHNRKSGLLENLKAQGKIWLSETECKKVITDHLYVFDTDVLFHTSHDNVSLLSDKAMQELKIDFLTWLIKKLEK